MQPDGSLVAFGDRTAVLSIKEVMVKLGVNGVAKAVLIQCFYVR